MRSGCDASHRRFGRDVLGLAVEPRDGETETDPVAPLLVHLDAPIDRLAIADRIVLTGPSGTPVDADIELLPGRRTVVITPLEGLAAGTPYSVIVRTGLTSIWGGRLGRDVSWRFTTAAERP